MLGVVLHEVGNVCMDNVEFFKKVLFGMLNILLLILIWEYVASVEKCSDPKLIGSTFEMKYVELFQNEDVLECWTFWSSNNRWKNVDLSHWICAPWISFMGICQKLSHRFLNVLTVLCVGIIRIGWKVVNLVWIYFRMSPLNWIFWYESKNYFFNPTINECGNFEGAMICNWLRNCAFQGDLFYFSINLGIFSSCGLLQKE